MTTSTSVARPVTPVSTDLSAIAAKGDADASRHGDAQPDLHATLRDATAAAHDSLEATLNLLRPPLDTERFVAVLGAFHGFHRALEPRLATALADPAFTQPRERLTLLAHDLAALGQSPADLRALPLCTDAAGLAADTDAALGALYVMEGSTLGGKVIGRALAQTAWCPAGGLRFFDAHGSQTGLMWRQTLALLATRANDPQRVAAGAIATFATLERWLARQLPTATKPSPQELAA